MVTNLKSIDSVRASREGHEFHEAWTARKALQLLLPTDNLVGIAVEGLSPVDQAAVASETVEIADITLYYGKNPTFEAADRVCIIQFKYSVRGRDDDFRASHAGKTVAKVAAAYLDHKKRSSENLPLPLFYLGSRLVFFLFDLFVEPHGHELGKWEAFVAGNPF